MSEAILDSGAIFSDSEKAHRRLAWLSTVDHKRIGILYLLTALVFFVVGGVEAIFIRLQLAIPNNTFIGPETYNMLFTMHGTTMIFLVAMPALFGLAKLLRPAADRRPRHGLPAPQRLHLLGRADGGHPPPFQHSRGGSPLRWLVRIRAPERDGVLLAARGRLLGAGPPRPRHRLGRHSHQPHRHRSSACAPPA